MGDFLLEDLPASHEIDGSMWLCVCELKSPENNLGNVASGPDLMVILHVLSHYAALIGHVLDPVDIPDRNLESVMFSCLTEPFAHLLITTPKHLALRRDRDHPCQYHDGHSSLAHVVNGSGQCLSSALNVNQHGGGSAGDLSISTCR